MSFYEHAISYNGHNLDPGAHEESAAGSDPSFTSCLAEGNLRSDRRNVRVHGGSGREINEEPSDLDG